MRPSECVGVEDGLGEGLWGFLGEVVADAAGYGPMSIFADELAGIGAGVGMRSAVRIAFKGDGGDDDGRAFGEALFQTVKPGIASGKAKTSLTVKAK